VRTFTLTARTLLPRNESLGGTRRTQLPVQCHRTVPGLAGALDITIAASASLRSRSISARVAMLPIPWRGGGFYEQPDCS